MQETKQVTHEYINCGSCVNYRYCKALDVKYRDRLVEVEGQWRRIFEGKKRVGSPTRRCSAMIIQKHLNSFKDKAVLEIGCGPRSVINYEFCKKNNVKYTGLDLNLSPAFHITPIFGRGKNLQHRLYLACLKVMGIKRIWKNKHQVYILDKFPSSSLANEKFDLIYGNSTIEHWHEPRGANSEEPDYINLNQPGPRPWKFEDVIEQAVCAYARDIEQCYDLLNPGGKLIQECPVFVHGNVLWKFAQIDYIEKLFSNAWTDVTFEHWREDPDDLMPYSPLDWKTSFMYNYGIEHKNIWDLNIVATK